MKWILVMFIWNTNPLVTENKSMIVHDTVKSEQACHKTAEDIITVAKTREVDLMYACLSEKDLGLLKFN